MRKVWLNILLALTAPHAFAETVSEADRVVVDFAVNNVEAIQKLVQMNRACLNCDNPTKKNEPKEPTPDLKVYQCTENSSGSPSPSPSPPQVAKRVNDPDQNLKKYQIGFYLLNDNIMMGLVPSGDDLGMTHEMGLQVLKELNNGGKLKFDVSSGIYTKRARPSFDPSSGMLGNGDLAAYQEAEEMLTNGEVNTINIVRANGDKIPVQFLDETKIKATYEKGKINAQGVEFYYTGTLGVALRQTSEKPGKLPPAASVQNWWHNTLGIYEFEYVPAEGTEAYVEKNGNVANVVTGYEGDKNLDAVSRISILAGGSVGMRKTVFTCQLELEAGALISTEGKKLVGPNSYLFARAEVSRQIFKKKNGQPALQASVGTAVFYYPSPKDTNVTKIGNETQLTLQGTIGKNGTVQPYFVFYAPGGRQQNHNLNDLNMRQTIGVKVNLGKKSSRVQTAPKF